VIRFKRWRWWTVALRGVAAILFGILSVFAPGVSFISLVLLFGIYSLVDGALALGLATKPIERRFTLVARGLVSIVAGVIAIRIRKEIEGEWLLVLEGILSLAFGVLLILAPLAGAIVLGLWIGVYALVLGGALLSTAFRLRSYARQQVELAA
jgi:uncharacterized membrane protein HdeD (DUF308 family)